MSSLRSHIAFAASAALLLPLGAPGRAAAEPCEGPPGPVRLYVNVEGVRTARGRIEVTVYPDNAARFLKKGGSLYVGRVNAQAGRTRVCLQLPRTGHYGLAVLHDANGNRKMDKNFLGLPGEGFGFSNNPVLRLGPPAFAKVRFAVPRSGVQTSVKLRYL
jgi:uncharacterized protein (DUF2141 family)